jgi:hypothetical protein
MKIEAPKMACKEGEVFTSWEIEEGSKEEKLMEDFVRSKFYPLIRKGLTYRASEITESLIHPLDDQSVKVDQGRIREILDLITYFDGCLLEKEEAQTSDTPNFLDTNEV